MISLLHFSYFKRLVRSPIWPVCPKIHQTSPPQQLLNLLFQRKSPRYLTPTDFIKNRGLVKWCPRKDLVCPHRALSTMSFPHPHTTAFGRGFVEGPQVAEGALAAQVLTEEAEGYRTWVIGNMAAQLMACFQKKKYSYFGCHHHAVCCIQGPQCNLPPPPPLQKQNKTKQIISIISRSPSCEAQLTCIWGQGKRSRSPSSSRYKSQTQTSRSMCSSLLGEHTSWQHDVVDSETKKQC